jgi:thiamine-phosphate pyrophosphorylase
LRKPVFCYVTDRRSLPAAAGRPAVADASPSEELSPLLDRLEHAASAGVDWIQLREKDLCGRDHASLVRRALDRLRSTGVSARLFVNDRLDVALAADTGGVHLGENSLPVAEACRLRDAFLSQRSAQPDFLIGASCHSLESAITAARDGADYIYFGPVFDTPSKVQYGPPQGLDRLANVCRAVQVPVIAIGGITLENASQCIASGAAGIAAIRLFQDPADIRPVMTRLRDSISA